VVEEEVVAEEEAVDEEEEVSVEVTGACCHFKNLVRATDPISSI